MAWLREINGIHRLVFGILLCLTLASNQPALGALVPIALCEDVSDGPTDDDDGESSTSELEAARPLGAFRPLLVPVADRIHRQSSHGSRHFIAIDQSAKFRLSPPLRC